MFPHVIKDENKNHTFQESDKLEGPKFANFPSLETSRKNSAGFKLSPDMPFEFAGENQEKKEEEADEVQWNFQQMDQNWRI